jgi:hypothetical protein
VSDTTDSVLSTNSFTFFFTFVFQGGKSQPV